jgi:hypothetical protein
MEKRQQQTEKKGWTQKKLKDMENNCIHQSHSQLSSWLVGDSGVNNSNPWLSTKSENQFLVEFTHPLPAYHLHPPAPISTKE